MFKVYYYNQFLMINTIKRNIVRQAKFKSISQIIMEKIKTKITNYKGKIKHMILTLTLKCINLKS